MIFVQAEWSGRWETSAGRFINRQGENSWEEVKKAFSTRTDDKSHRGGGGWLNCGAWEQKGINCFCVCLVHLFSTQILYLLKCFKGILVRLKVSLYYRKLIYASSGNTRLGEAGMEEFNIIFPTTPGERTNCSPNSQVGEFQSQRFSELQWPKFVVSLLSSFPFGFSLNLCFFLCLVF